MDAKPNKSVGTWEELNQKQGRTEAGAMHGLSLCTVIQGKLQTYIHTTYIQLLYRILLSNAKTIQRSKVI
jgi:hypothetical protein